MNILDLFAEKYLTNYDVESPVNNDIVTDGDCFFHALEYASGDGLQDHSTPLCINSLRKDLSDLYVEVIKKNRSHRKAIDKNRLIEEVKTFRSSKKYAEEGIIRMGIVYKQKAFIILKPREKFPNFLTLQIITNNDIGLHFNKYNVIFLIQEMDEVRQIGLHFKTFKNSLCRRVFPNEKFIEKLNRDIDNPRIFQNNGEDPDDNSIDFTSNIMSFDNAIARDTRIRNREVTPHVSPTNSIKLIEKQFKNMEKREREGNYKSNSSSISSISSNSGANFNNHTPNRRFIGRYTKLNVNKTRNKHKTKGKKPPGKKTRGKPYKGTSLNSRSRSSQSHSNVSL